MNPDVPLEIVERYVAQTSEMLLPKEQNYERNMQETTVEELQGWARQNLLVMKGGPQRTLYHNRTTSDMVNHFATHVTIAVRSFDDNGTRRLEVQDGYNTLTQLGLAVSMKQPQQYEEFEGHTLAVDESVLHRCLQCRIFMDVYKGDRADRKSVV